MFFHTSHIACMTKIRRNGSTDTWWKCKLSSKETAALFNIPYNVLSNPEIPLLDRTLEKPRHILAPGTKTVHTSKIHINYGMDK